MAKIQREITNDQITRCECCLARPATRYAVGWFDCWCEAGQVYVALCDNCNPWEAGAQTFHIDHYEPIEQEEVAHGGSQ